MRSTRFWGARAGSGTFINFRPSSRLASNININTSRFTDPRGLFLPGLNEGERDERGEIFHVNIIRALNTYQFTDRLLFRNITEFNTFDETLGLNFLVTYRVNSGTAFYIGYDDHYQQREQFDDQVNIHRQRLSADQPGSVHEDPVSVQILVWCVRNRWHIRSGEKRARAPPKIRMTLPWQRPTAIRIMPQQSDALH